MCHQRASDSQLHEPGHVIKELADSQLHVPGHVIKELADSQLHVPAHAIKENLGKSSKETISLPQLCVAVDV